MPVPAVLFVVYDPSAQAGGDPGERLARLCREGETRFARVEVLYFPGSHLAAGRLAEGLRALDSGPEVNVTLVAVENSRDAAVLLAALEDFFRRYPFLVAEERYFVLLPEGAPRLQAVLLRLVTSHHLPAEPVSLRLRQDDPAAAQTPSLETLRLPAGSDAPVAAEQARERREALTFLQGGIPTHSEPLLSALDGVERAALRSREAILLRGEPGTGKSHLARRIYELRRVRHHLRGRLVTSSGVSLRDHGGTLSLVGRAGESPAGLFARADGGVLLVDEIDQAGPEQQAQILRTLEDRAFLPVGGTAEVPCSLQMIATTDADLAARAARGEFRADLLAKLETWSFDLPPLRERLSDIPAALDFLMLRVSRRTGESAELSGEPREALLAALTGRDAIWKNNLRDLLACATRLCAVSGDAVTMDDVEREIETLREIWSAPRAAGRESPLVDLLTAERVAALDRFDRVQLAEVVRVCRSCRTLSEAGRTLFQASRRRRKVTNDADRLRKYLAKFGIDWRDLVDPGA